MGAFSLARAVRIRRVAVAVSMLALAGVICGGTTTAQASDRAVAGPAGTGCPRSVTGGTVTASATVSSASWPAAGRSGVPWRSVGRGWILADLATSMSASGPGALYLVSPRGQRYRLGQAPANASLEDWSGDSRDALFLAQKLDSTTGVDHRARPANRKGQQILGVLRYALPGHWPSRCPGAGRTS